MCTFFTIDKYYYVFLKCVNQDIIIMSLSYTIQMVKLYLTKEATATVIPAFVTSRLENSNALLYGFP